MKQMMKICRTLESCVLDVEVTAPRFSGPGSPVPDVVVITCQGIMRVTSLFRGKVVEADKSVMI